MEPLTSFLLTWCAYNENNNKKVLLPFLLEAENSGMIIQILLNLSDLYVHKEKSRPLDHY